MSVVHREGRPTAEDYSEAIEALMDARNQLEPDGRNCVVCGDSGHQAWECHHNPLVMARRFSAIMHAELWRCFHCNELFSSEATAREHFGKAEDEIARCLLARETT